MPEDRCESIGSFRNRKEVDVVYHEATCERLQPMLLGILQEELAIALAIAVVEKHVFSSIAPLRDGMRNSRNYHPAIRGMAQS